MRKQHVILEEVSREIVKLDVIRAESVGSRDTRHTGQFVHVLLDT